MDTKLKNRHKLAVIVILSTILLAASVVVSQYRGWSNGQQSAMQQEKHDAVTSEEFLSRFAEASYILYNTENWKSSDEIRSEYSGMVSEYEAFYPYLDYVVLDENRETVERSTVNSTQGELSESRLQPCHEGAFQPAPSVRTGQPGTGCGRPQKTLSLDPLV